MIHNRGAHQAGNEFCMELGKDTKPLNGGVRKGSNAHPELSLEFISPHDLKLDPNNPRIHAAKQIRQIGESIERLGFNVPVQADSEGTVVAGHGRVLAARELGMPLIPVIRLEHLTRAQLRAFAIADNKLTENAEWNPCLLGEQLKALSEVGLDFNVEVTGFEMSEIDMLIEGLQPATKNGADPADELLDSDATVPVSKSGDLWLVGAHRVLCGNCLDARSYSALMEDRRASMVFTDPPSTAIDGHTIGLGAIHSRDLQMASGEMNEAEFTDFLARAFKLLALHAVDGSLHFAFIDWRHLPEILAAGKQIYTELKAVCVWVKDNGGMGSLYRSQHELVLVFKSGKASHLNNVQLGQFGRTRTNVWKYPGVNPLSRLTGEANLPQLHPSAKPVALVADAIMDCSARGDIILDPFCGSGTTMIAAERTGRTCYGMEIDPVYVDTIVRRWQRFTGLSARHAISGKSFDELEKEQAQ